MCLTARAQLDASHLAVEPGLRSLQHAPLDPSLCSSLSSSKLDVYNCLSTQEAQFQYGYENPSRRTLHDSEKMEMWGTCRALVAWNLLFANAVLNTYEYCTE
jgi:hypothetical protein